MNTQIKPKLRGWLHAGTFPFAIAATVILIIFSPDNATRLACLTFGIASSMLFGTSAVYHLGSWTERVSKALRRADHSNIFLIIAGTYTPLAVTLLPKKDAIFLLVVVWVGAIAGLSARIIWINAPRWVYVPIYIGLGWVAVAYLGKFYDAGGPAVMWLVIAGGLLYTAGAVIYALKRPNPWPNWFGFHEIFHSLTVLAFSCHVTAIMLAVI